MIKYRCLMRPPMPGAVPREGLNAVWFDEGETPSGHHYWGTAVYTKELTAEEISHYDLEVAHTGGTDNAEKKRRL